MANIRVVKTTIDDAQADTTIKPGAVGGDNQARQLWQGPGILLAMSLNRTDSSGLVTTIYDSATGDSAAPTIYTQTGDADLGLTVPVGFVGSQATAVTANELYIPIFSTASTAATAVEWEVDYIFGACAA